LRLAVLINLYRVARAWEEFQPVARFAGELMSLLEVCADQAMHTAAWLLVGVHGETLLGASAAWERAIACARVARNELRLGPEFGVATDLGWALGSTLWSYADILIEHGEFARAAPLLAECLSLSQVQGNHYSLASALGVAGRLAMLQGDLPRAHTLLREAVTIGTTLNYQRVLGESQSILGIVTLYSGDIPVARQLLEDSLRLCLALNDSWYLGRVCTGLAELALSTGELDEARRWLAQSSGYYAHPHLIIRMDFIEHLAVAARLAAARRDWLPAASLFGSVTAACHQIRFEPAGPARQLADDAIAQTRAALGPAAYDAACAEGQQLSIELAFHALLASGAAAGAPAQLI
jgi:hypothetical protein